MKYRVCFLFCFLALAGHAQLTTDQRQADFRSLVDLYSRRYAPIAWKQELFNFNVLDLSPWTGRVAQVTNDLDFYDLLFEYVSDLQDAHDQYQLPSDFEAQLGFTVDLYDGKVVVDSIDPSVLSTAAFPIQVGDEVVSVDGESAADWVQALSKYVSGGNPRTVQRLAAGLITDRLQAEDPYAVRIVASATVVILDQTGSRKTYTIPWSKSGTPLTSLGASAGPQLPRPIPPRRILAASRARRKTEAAQGATPPYYQQFLQQFHQYFLPGRINVLGFDQLQPVFTLPDNFVQRLGTQGYDSYYSGSFTAPDGTRIGYLRIPDFLFADTAALDTEIHFFQNNTDVLVVDVMRNPGGDVCAAEETLARLTPSPFQGAAAELRPDWTQFIGVKEALSGAQNDGADADTIAQLELYQAAFAQAFPETANTTALPLCASTLVRQPASAPYTKPVLLLTDEMSASSADIFSALAQDNRIATLLGFRTMGAGGSPEGDSVGIYTEGTTSVTRSLVVRPHPVTVPGYPTTSYIENVGVWPDLTVDLMTEANLLNQDAGFVDAFTAAAIKLAHAASGN